MRAWNLVGHTRYMSCVVAAVAGLVVAIRKDGQMTLGLGSRQLWFGARLV